MSSPSEHAAAGYVDACYYCGESLWEWQTDHIYLEGKHVSAHKSCFEEAEKFLEEMGSQPWGEE